MNYRLTAFILLGSLISMSLFSQQIKFETNPETGAICQLQVANDVRQMNWLIATDGSQYPWVTEKYGWGLGYFTETKNGIETQREWLTPSSGKTRGEAVTYRAGDIQIDVKRSLSGSDLVERYTLTNRGKEAVLLSNIGIYTPFNDNYPDAKTCMEARAHAHVWDGGSAAYVNATHMGGNPPHVGLVLTDGTIKSYEIWERGLNKLNSQTRGVIALNIHDAQLAPGQKTSFSWRIFSHTGWDDFYNKIQGAGNIRVICNQYTFQKGETARLEILGNERLLKRCTVSMNGRSVEMKKVGRKWMVETRMDELGEVRFDIAYGKDKQTYVDCIVFSNYEKLVDARVGFILEHQQMNDVHDLRDGAYMVYDNETEKIYLNDTPNANPADRDEGAERIGMGILLAKKYQQTKEPALKESLLRYARFIRKKLQTEDYTTYSSVDKRGRNRGYNYMWVATFYFQMYRVTGDKQFAVDGYLTMQSMYRHFGYGFYAINIPVQLGLQVLQTAGLSQEHDKLKADFIKAGDIFVTNSLNYPKHEVNYEQSIVAPAITFLTQLYSETGIRKYLDEAERQLPVLEAFGGFQPSYHMNEIAIRHWDGYWFGKRELWGDNYPHYWSTATGVAYHYYARCTGDLSYQKRAENIVRNNLCLFTEEGRGWCAYVYPYRVNGEKAGFYDPYANDQDWALVYFMLVYQNL